MKKIIIAAFTFLSITATAQQKDYTYYKTIAVGDQSGWDYVAADELNRNIYFSHATKTLVASMDNDSLVGEIPKTFGVHGIAIDNELNKGFISNGKANSVTVFNLKTFAVIDTIAVNGINPDAILYDEYSKKVFAFNGKTNNVTVIDAASLKIVASITLPGKPEFGVTDLKGKIYVNIEDKSELVQIDAVTLTVLKTWTVAPGDEPSGLAIDRANNLLFSVCSNKELIVFDIKKEKVIDSIPIGGRVDAVVFDPQSKLIYSSNGEGNVTIIKQQSISSYKIVQTLTTQKGCKTMMLDSKTKKIYLPAAKYEGDTKKILPGSFEILIFR
ncbi:YncE family protein [Ferruginibacter sp. SUN106]|uniref:YncE family protein n=1 Tax=Ferruginibacter sp. SUN106 TaxID=2978348 RepID=UPI003D36E9D4